MSKIPEWAEREAAELWASLGFVNDRLNHVPTIALALVAAEKRGIERAAELIEEGYERTVANPYRDDGRPSKNDECPHAKYEYEDCEQCAAAAIRQLGDEE